MCVIETVTLIRSDGTRIEQPYQILCEDSRGGHLCQNVAYRDLGERPLPPLGGGIGPTPGYTSQYPAYQPQQATHGMPTDLPTPPSQPSHSRPGTGNQKDDTKPKTRPRQYWIREKPTTKLGLGLFRFGSKKEKKDDTNKRKKDKDDIIPDPPPRIIPVAPTPPPAVPNWGQPPPPPPGPGNPAPPAFGRRQVPTSPTDNRFSYPPACAHQGSTLPSPTFPPQPGRVSAEPVYEIRDPPHRRLSNSSRQPPRQPNVIHQPSLRIPSQTGNRNESSPTPPLSGTGSSPVSMPSYGVQRPMSPPSTTNPSPPMGQPQQRQSAPADIQSQRPSASMPTGASHRPSASQPNARTTSGTPPNAQASSSGRLNDNTSSKKASPKLHAENPEGTTRHVPNPDEELNLRATHREARRLERERNDLEARLRAREVELEQARRDLEREKERNRAQTAAGESSGSSGANRQPSQPHRDARPQTSSAGHHRTTSFTSDKGTASYPHPNPLRSNPTPHASSTAAEPSTSRTRETDRERDRERRAAQVREEERTATKARIARLERETSDLRRQREAAQEAFVAQLEADERYDKEHRPQLGSRGRGPPSPTTDRRRPPPPEPPRRTTSFRESRNDQHRRPAHHSDGDVNYARNRRASGVSFDLPRRDEHDRPQTQQSGFHPGGFSFRTSNFSSNSPGVGVRRSNTFSGGTGGNAGRPPPPPPPPLRTTGLDHGAGMRSRETYDDRDEDDGYGSEGPPRARDRDERRRRKDRRRRSRDRDDRKFWR